MRGEGRDEGASTLGSGWQRSDSLRGPLTLASLDLSPHAGRGEHAAAFPRRRCARGLLTTFVTTGLDPVAHAEVRLRKAYRQIRSSFPSAWIAGSSPAMTKEKGPRKKRKRNADRRVSQPPRLTGAARVHRRHVYASLRTQNPLHALAYRRSTTALAVWAFGPWAQLQARLPGTWQDVRSGTVAPTGEQRSCALTRALPAPACPSPGNAPPGPVVVPVSMMPEAARVRSVSLRPRAPHSPHLQEYPRPKASFTERDSNTRLYLK
jgi:hypothetical protein